MVHLGVLNRKTKMKVFIVFAAALLAANALFLQEEWEQFKINYNKSHQNVVEETLRFQIFKNNLKKINEHNIRYEVGLETYYMGVNQFADLTEKELGDLFRLQNGKIPEIEKSLHEEIGAAPESIDWRQKNAVLQVKNQGQIGTCWDFSATGALEGQNAILNNKKVALSEQELLDCSGGDMNAEFEYVRDNGLTTEESYPYVGRQNKCNKPSGESAIKITGFKSVDSTETALKNAVGTVGPISAAVYIQPMFFYNGGIFSDEYCYNDYQHLEHGVLVVGYGTENGREYWIVKNSWGANWGEDGYFRLARNANQCGIALHASYPTL